MSSTEDNHSAIGNLDRQEILTYLMIAVFGGFVVIVFTILFLILSNPNVVEKLIISGTIDLGIFVARFDEILVAFLVLLGVGVGAKTAKKG